MNTRISISEKKSRGSIPVIEDYEKIVRSKNKCILNAAFRQGKVFERFKNSERFGGMLKELNEGRSTVYFNLNLLKNYRRNIQSWRNLR